VTSLRIVAYLLLFAALTSALVPLLPAAEALPVWKHHLVHALVLALSASAGFLFAYQTTGRRAARGGAEIWLYVTVCTPVISMFLMWPTTYAWLEHHPHAHSVEHLGFVALGFAAAYGGERYMPGVGLASGAATVLSAVVAAFGLGSGRQV
jgi:hypothetical protein